MKLSEFVKKYREEHDISQRKLSELAGLSHGYIYLLEKETNPNNGKKFVPTLENLNKIAKAMGMTLTELLKSVDNMPVNINGTGNIDLLVTSELHERAVNVLNKLNDHGLLKIIELAEDLLQLEKYKKDMI